MNHGIELATIYADHTRRLETAYADALAGAEHDALVIHSGAAAKQSSFDDQYWPHKATPAFAHWVPLGEPEAAVVVRPGAKPLLVRTKVTDFWESAPEPEGDHFWPSFEVVEVSDAAAIADHVPSGRVAFIGDDDERAASWGITDSAINPAALVSALDHVRSIKSAYEVTCIREANRRAIAGHYAVFEAFDAGGVSELDLHLLYLRTTGQDDADTPYKNIVAMERNAAVLHHVRYGRAAPDGATSLLVDAGATFMGYASDITRTRVRGDGDAAIEFGALVDGLKSLQQSIIASITIGSSYEALHDEAHRLLAGVLRDQGIANGSDGELVDAGVTRALFPHGLGHSLGIQVHDVGCREREPRADNPFLRNTTDIAAGQVFTIEPGCYFISELLDELRESPRERCINWPAIGRLEAFGGIRIEDNIAVTSGGVQNLTRPDDNDLAKP